MYHSFRIHVDSGFDFGHIIVLSTLAYLCLYLVYPGATEAKADRADQSMGSCFGVGHSERTTAITLEIVFSFGFDVWQRTLLAVWAGKLKLFYWPVYE